MKLEHPLPLETKVIVNKPSCQCRGAKMQQVNGIIKKVINNHKGIWYYLDIGYTVNSEHVIGVEK